MDEPPVLTIAPPPVASVKKRMPTAPKSETKTESDMMKDRLNASLEASAGNFSERAPKSAVKKSFESEMNDKREHVCSVCFEKFASIAYLRRHMAKHD
jgi:hypothetical protein